MEKDWCDTLKVLGYFQTATERIEIKTFEDIMYVKYRLRRIRDEIIKETGQ